MPTEQRVISSKAKIAPKQTIGGSAASGAAAAEEEAPKKGKKKKLLLVVLAVLVAGAAAWWFLMGPGAGKEEAAAEEPAHEPGEVLVVESISLNLEGSHYLRLGMGLQMTADAHGEVDSARALDLAIALFSGRPVAEVASSEGRAALKAELLHQLEEAYHGEVMDLYFTEYVTQ